jgi:hypothetical protein
MSTNVYWLESISSNNHESRRPIAVHGSVPSFPVCAQKNPEFPHSVPVISFTVREINFHGPHSSQSHASPMDMEDPLSANYSNANMFFSHLAVALMNVIPRTHHINLLFQNPSAC